MEILTNKMSVSYAQQIQFTFSFKTEVLYFHSFENETL